MRHTGREALHEPFFRGALAAVVVGAIGIGIDTDRGIVLLIAVATGVITREVSASFQALQRRTTSAEDHQALLALVETGAPPPLFGGWAIGSDFGRLLLEQLRRRPGVVVECGSGVSTLVIASALRANDVGKLYSLEHDLAFADETRSLLEDRCLQDWAEVHSAPLASQTFGSAECVWYDAGRIPDQIGPIDLLVIDGPPPVQPLSRWPALQVFYPMLSANACVLLDDGRRRSERRTVLRWAASFPDLDLYWIDTVKGTWMLLRNSDAVPESRWVSAARRVRRTLHPRPPGFGHWPVRR